MNNFENLKNCIDTRIEEKTVENIIVRVGHGGEILCDVKRTVQDRVLSEETLFDMASVTKIVVTTSLALIAIDKGLLSPSDLVSKFFLVPEDKAGMTIKHLMTHTVDFSCGTLRKCGYEGGYEGVENCILSVPLNKPLGSSIRYSCFSFILLGRILETIYGERLDVAFRKHVAEPLGMTMTTFLPDITLDIVNARMLAENVGIVHDPNCRRLGCVAGNAGLFSNLKDMTLFAKMLMAHGSPLFSKDTFMLAAENYTANMETTDTYGHRGLGYIHVNKHFGQAAGLFPDGSIGHCGHTGQSVFVDPESGLYVIILSDATRSVEKKLGKHSYEPIVQMRRELHSAIKADLGL